MSSKRYSNFVRPASPTRSRRYSIQAALNGEEARRLYLEEVKDIKEPIPASEENYQYHKVQTNTRVLRRKLPETQSDKDLFISVQNDDVDTVRRILDSIPDKINTLDGYGWSLLMIACQANAIETTKELLKRGINRDIRDKAGNSAQSLVVKNRNFVLPGILLEKFIKPETQGENKHKKVKLKEFVCNICNNKTFSDKEGHLSSTIHNINASKGKKIPTNYVIPASNKGYQLMLKVGWDKESGLGPGGTGAKYPIRTMQKKDRKGLGHGKKKDEMLKQETGNQRKMLAQDNQNSKRMEINFRRQFY